MALALPAFAQQEVAEDRQAQPQSLERVEVRGRQATETELRRRQPVAKQIYGRDDLDKYGDTQLSDVLKRLFRAISHDPDALVRRDDDDGGDVMIYHATTSDGGGDSFG